MKADDTRPAPVPAEWALQLLASIWIAEYLEAGATNARLNRGLFEALSGRMTLGRWVALARRIRADFISGNRETVVEGLAALDFGEPGDLAHPVARLVELRNAFAHGGLRATEDEVRTEAELLESLLSRVPGLRSQPVLFRADDGRLRTVDSGLPEGHGAPVPAPSLLDEAPLEPPFEAFVVGRDGRRLLHLHPLLRVVPAGDGYRLMLAEGEGRKQPVPALFEREVLRDWYARYVREKQGHVEFGEALAERARRALSDSLAEEVAEALRADGVSLVVVEVHPGCGKADVLAALPDLARRGSLAACGVWLVEPGDVGASGLTFVNFLLRKTETCLGRQDGALGMAARGWREALQGAIAALREAGMRVLVGLEDLHFGYEPAGDEPVSVAEVYRALDGSPFSALATIHPGRAPGRVAFDRLVRMPVPAPDDVDLERLALAIGQLCTNERPLRRRVLEELVRRDEPTTLFDLCDALDAQGGKGEAVFEPAVERTLRDLRPLLRVEGSGDERTWRPFSPALARVVGPGASR